ncbi:LysM peptidoglycan-binding domain-containing protein [Anabaena cylindrica FACHB-243]|uniref:Peptidoglycan-binding lysin domain protein n=1 Tax=Anabaena cylindrica (strain ATCC 27899 / PCC 7122) TaxID=272123 RepID=K9ZJZ3_ANACC|nr:MULTISPECIES: LysM domain-containing protein [Anabaena]AFZ59526.1 Peptidoglycan-binding lysin domain protein [Anabaena cylindrica PCC 7122]MBD2418808.1 LysM peptidoglycan-binding domain-containing protein [Anabaena cylindrica FACHB-243]MBY5283316.1 LysM peptidoglycan-binding domain-containing protein [Anabaena sp. CCAP 1446/1C]MBY5306791.1 LysM peptidoglycan-binding domain-containing protein [Anabaena sp. CCAP 1446/1C]MCM2406373.1 LysM peptidoglycan-binding domain-containing protein [Anabae
MNTKINCPVCGYQDIENNICPNCDTDLSLIRTLQELPLIEKKSLKRKFSGWTLAVALLMLIIGMGLGVGSSLIIVQSGLYNATISNSNTTVVNSIKSTANKPVTQPNIYTVKPGDNLSLIALKLCGQGGTWEMIVKANPELEKRKNYYIDPGEELKIPNCQEKTE